MATNDELIIPTDAEDDELNFSYTRTAFGRAMPAFLKKPLSDAERANQASLLLDLPNVSNIAACWSAYLATTWRAVCLRQVITLPLPAPLDACGVRR